MGWTWAWGATAAPAATTAARPPPNDEPPPPSPPPPPPASTAKRRGGHVVQRSRANLSLVDDYVQPPTLGVVAAAPPPFLRGPVLRLWLLKQALAARVHAVIGVDAAPASAAQPPRRAGAPSAPPAVTPAPPPTGLVAQHGFQGGPTGAARAAADALVADLTGGPGAVSLSGPEEAVDDLHERVFCNYNRWARLVGASGVYSVDDDPDRLSIRASHAAVLAARQSTARARLVPRDAAGRQPAPAPPAVAGSVADAHHTASGSSLASSASAAAGGTGTGAGTGVGAGAATAAAAALGVGSPSSAPPLPPATMVAGSSADDVEAQKQHRNSANQPPPPPLLGDGAHAAGEPALRRSSQPGSDTHTRLADLALYYCIRSEAANLRFMPECLCWLFHQMRRGYCPPLPAELLASGRGSSAGSSSSGSSPLDSSVFARSTVAPLYALLKRNARKEVDAGGGSGGDAWWPCAVAPCCRKTGRRRWLANSQRPNYDDLNELFWDKSCLSLGYHTCSSSSGSGGLAALQSIPKSFREKASWLAVALTFYRWLGFVAVSFHALAIVGGDIVAAGGVNLLGVTLLEPVAALAHACGAFQTLALLQLLLCVAAASHALPTGGGCGPAATAAARGSAVWGAAKLLYALAWAGGLLVLGNAKALLGGGDAGAPASLYLVLCAAKAGALLLSEGALLPVRVCGPRNPLRRLLQQLEGVYYVSPPGGRGHVLGREDMVQPLARKAGYYAFWALVLGVKLAFDLQVLTQQQRLVATLQGARGLAYLPPWSEVSFAGLRHPVAVVGSWAVTAVLVCLDSYIAFTLAAPLLGYFVLAADGVGAIRRRHEITAAFTRGVGWRNGTPLAAQFVRVAMPLAAARGVDANRVFRAAWDQFVMSLREGDLISNAEQCKLLYSDGVVAAVPTALPLFMYAGKVRELIRRAGRVAHAARTCDSDAAFLVRALPDAIAAEAVGEVLAALPPMLALVCQSHSAIGYHDPHVGAAIHDLFRPAHGQTLRDCVAALLEGGGGAADSEDDSPTATLRRLAGCAAAFVLEFERQAASTRLRGSPLLAATTRLLRLLHRLWNPRPPAGGDGGGDGDGDGTMRQPPSGAPASSHPQHRQRGVDPSFPGVTLEHIAAVASRDVEGDARGDSDADGEGAGLPPLASPGASSHRHAHADSHDAYLLDARTVPGILKLLATPNEASGRLDGDGDGRLVELLESLRDAARRVFYLLTMVREDGALAVPEASRRVTHFINSLYMHALTPVESVLDMPSLSCVTPQYNETVIYSRRELGAVNKHGVSTLVYLKSLHAAEWANCLERLGARDELGAWAATRDALGTAISGEVEVRLWASQRGQTLARTVHGVMEYARAIRLLATLQLELEYAAGCDDEAPAPAAAAAATGGRSAPPRPASRAALEADAAAAAQWFTAERFQYVVAAQRYAEHGEDDVRRRSDLDFLLLCHPLLVLAYYESAVSPATGKRALQTVCKAGRGVRYRLPCPGNGIVDGIGEGKPENQNVAAPFVSGRVLQALDMNQEIWFEEALKLPNALACLGAPAPASGRPVVLLGLREHIYTQSLSAPAFFMAQQEYLFGVMFQRIMHSPLHVRMHYGHPDLMDKVWMATRGGTAKASAVINVSEDVFAGYTCCLRGGESAHCEFMQAGKGRDVGVLQICMFEGKISAGTAVSLTTRDAFRVAEGMDAARLVSYYHTSGGFYIANALIVLSFMVNLYYLAGLALTGIDRAILGTRTIYLLGEVSFLQWYMQLGLTALLPLAALYALEHGALAALWRTLRMLLALGPLFFMLEIQTKAYFFDAALAFGKCGYAATGRDFVLRHVAFHENYAALALSHLFVGCEALLLLALATAYGTYRSLSDYLFFTLAGWLFALSLVAAAFVFNPYQMELRVIRCDASEWAAWLSRPDGGADVSWRAWYDREVGGQYAQANVGTRAWRLLRASRLLLLLALMTSRLGASSRRGQPLVTWALYAGLGLAVPLALQLAHALQAGAAALAASRHRGAATAGGALTAATAAAAAAAAAASRGATEGIARRRGRCDCCSAALAHRSALWSVACGAVAVAAGVLPTGVAALLFAAAPAPAAPPPPPGASDALLGALCLAVALRWATCALHILSVTPLADGARDAHLLLDACTGAALLASQAAAALCVPLGSVLHTRLLFAASYADTVETITGASRMLARQAGGAARGAHFLQLSHLGELEFKRGEGGRPASGSKPGGGGGHSGAGAVSGRPENLIGVRRTRLRALHELQTTTTTTAQGAAGAFGAAASADCDGSPTAPTPLPVGVLSGRATWLQVFRTASGEDGAAAAGGESPLPASAVAAGRARARAALAGPALGRDAAAAAAAAAAGSGGLSIRATPPLAHAGDRGRPPLLPDADDAAAAGGAPRVRKSLKEILSEHASSTAGGAANAAAAHPRGGAHGAAAVEPAGGSRARGGGGNAEGAVGSRFKGGIPRGGIGGRAAGAAPVAAAVKPNYVIVKRSPGADGSRGGGGGGGVPRVNASGGGGAGAKHVTIHEPAPAGPVDPGLSTSLRAADGHGTH